MKVQYTAAALTEIAEIVSYIAKDSPAAAERLSAAIWQSVSLISRDPRMHLWSIGMKCVPKWWPSIRIAYSM